MRAGPPDGVYHRRRWKGQGRRRRLWRRSLARWQEALDEERVREVGVISGLVLLDLAKAYEKV